jgi:glycosyltransferase involved in cell wall biosynthesis
MQEELFNLVLVGHPFSPTGRGEDLRSSFRSFRSIGQLSTIRDIYGLNERNDPDWERQFGDHQVKRLSPQVNIFHINGNEVEQSLQHIGDDLPEGAYNIVYPAWELSIYPNEWARQLERFDEIWAPSKFTKESMADVVSRPVLHMPLPSEVKISPFLGRRFFGIPESSYVFLFFFDFTSFVSRKNPFAVLEAFEKLCTTYVDIDCRLVIKSNQPHYRKEDFRRFNAALKSNRFQDRIIVIDRTLGDNEVKNLIRCSDCFVSLHRSEGFGRGLAEAMYLGKPVIATSYSGNLDFMTEEKSCLVEYELVPVGVGDYPYAEGQVWAEPDIDQAVGYMSKLLQDHEYGRAIGENASRDIRVNNSYRAAGLRYMRRITEVMKESNLKIQTNTSICTQPNGLTRRELVRVPRDNIELAEYEKILQQIEIQIADVSAAEVPNLFRDLPLGVFGWLTLQEQNQYPNIKDFLPSMPTDEIQLKWTGASGKILLEQSIAFMESVVQYARREFNSDDLSELKLLDFGCGWGRLLRLLYKYIPTINLFAVDAWEPSLHHCNNNKVRANIAKIEEICVEIPFEDKFDLVISFSVFTHLSKRSAEAALKALRASIDDNGLMIVTVRPKEFIPEFLSQYDVAASAEEIERLYQEDGFVFIPHNREPVDGDITYGDTFISVDYIKMNWSDWRIVETQINAIDPYQKLIVLKPR